MSAPVPASCGRCGADVALSWRSLVAGVLMALCPGCRRGVRLEALFAMQRGLRERCEIAKAVRAPVAPEKLSSRAAAHHIRKTLRAVHGWTSHDVSVRVERYSMGSTIHVVGRRADIPLHVLEEIATPYEVVRRDACGDILSGGNRFVDVRRTS